tara:strand:- start:12 stop:266 length:255 start_codon:yes stop_codon:yes gene_type:complete
MIDKKQLIEELLECVKDATDTETKITGLSMCAMLMNEVLDEALTIPVVVGQSEQLRFLIDKFQTPKGNYLIDLLMEHKESKEKP